MNEYQKPYQILFTSILNAIDEINRLNFGIARDILIKAQQDSEEEFISFEQGKK